VVVVVLVGLSVVASACSSGTDEGQATTTERATTTEAPATTEETTTDPPPTSSSTTSTVAETTTSSSTTTTAPPPPPTDGTTTTAAPAAGAPNPACIYTIEPGDSLNAIITNLANPAVSVDAVAVENGIGDPNVITTGDPLDVCPGNGVDDISGALRAPPDTTPEPEPETTLPPDPTTPDTVAPGTPLPSGVEAQQAKLNELFTNKGLSPLTVDGQSGRQTRQQLCAARVALNIPVSRDAMAPGSLEEIALMQTNTLPTPPTAPVQAGRWVLIDQTCQIMFVGDGPNNVVFVFPTSTGLPQYRTRDQEASRVFRYDPATANKGWHDSSQYPAASDNPLNGNMYKPLYFDNGQAIHGANTVPTSPASHGCARLRVADQDTLINWLGLGDQKAQIWNDRGRIGLTVTVQGTY
jgi:lipoprotein-anchoring transpeptidase ErfK/SrfK